ncbi:type 2 isopentenyl-diphosphate Delta-isomerase [Thermodesulfobacteriota bacterium]
MKITKQRKTEHIRICLDEQVEIGDPLLDDVALVHQALPEADLESLDIAAEFLGKRLSFPLVIAGITGGCDEAREINRSLARVAERCGIGFGVGSQRAMIEDASLADTYRVRDEAPGALVLGNVGITALRQYAPERINEALQAIGADGVCVHLNPAQEIFQAEGDFDFSGCLDALEAFCGAAAVPVVAKEVGNGISRHCALQLKQAGVSAIDVGGYGGTSWVIVDSIRSGLDADSYRSWGIPTAAAVLEAGVGLPLIATGGVRSGLQMAKAIALGADVCGIALPFLKALDRGGEEAAGRYVELLVADFRRAMFLTGCRNLAELRSARVVLSGRLKAWQEQLPAAFVSAAAPRILTKS